MAVVLDDEFCFIFIYFVTHCLLQLESCLSTVSKLDGVGVLNTQKKLWLYYFHVLIASFFYSNCLNIPTVSLTRLEVSIYFSVNFFFFFTQLFFKNISIILSILHGILLKYCSSKNISLKFYFFINFLLLSNRLSLYL